MKLFIPNISSTKIGGGWTFLRNFKSAMLMNTDTQIVEYLEDADILFAFAPTTVDQGTIDKAKALGKKFVLRMDGIPEDNRNRGAGTRKLIEFSQQADLVIYQTNFVLNTVGKILEMHGVKNSKVVMNGVDVDIFTPNGAKLPNLQKFKNILHVNYRKDNNKRVEEVIQMYRELWTIRQDVRLVLVGRYPTEWIDYNMGFFNGERVMRVAPTEPEHLAMIMRSCDLFFYPSFADPSPNVVMEAMASGLPCLVHPYGGASEIVSDFNVQHIDYNEMLGDQVDALLRNDLSNVGTENRNLVANMYPLPELARNYQSALGSVL